MSKRKQHAPEFKAKVVRFYNQRITAEQHIKEGKQAINWTRLSCKGLAQNGVRLQLMRRPTISASS